MTVDRTQYHREWRKKHPENVRSYSQKKKQYQIEWNKKNPEKARSYRQKGDARRTRLARLSVLKQYGMFCNCCGESNSKFLVIDHINGGGSKHRREVGAGTRFYDWLRLHNWPSGYQVLCHNCNWGRRINNGVCPHQEIIKDVMHAS